jgi:hypothetical protein
MTRSQASAPSDLPTDIARRLAIAAGLAYVALYLFIAIRRMAYPFELEWMEGGAVDHVRRILAGQPLYVPPSLDFVPYTYTPLYFYVSAAVARLTGIGMFPLRLVSFLASIGSMALIAWIVRRRTGGWTAPILAVALFAATYRAAGAWFDIARVDSLFLLFVLGAIAALQVRPSQTAGIVAGILIGLSFFTKQAGITIGTPIVIAAIVRDRRMGIVCAASSVALVTGGIIGLDRVSGGWFSFYVFRLPSLHGIVRKMLLDYWTLDLGRRFLIGCVLTSVLFASRHLARRERLTLGVIAAGMIGGTYVVRIRAGSYDNTLMPAYAMIAILSGMALPIVARPGRAILGYGAWLAQFALLLYNPAPQLPTRADLIAGRALVERIRQVEGPVYIPCHGYLAAMAGKPTHAQMMALGDALRSPRPDVRDRLNAEVTQAIREHRFAAIIQDGDWLPELERYYAPTGPVFQDEKVFWTRTGLRTRPQLIFLPRPRPSP